MNKKIKIAHIVGGLHSGGVEAVIYNYFSHMDMDRFEVHIISNSPSVPECEELFCRLGCIIHVLPERKKHLIDNIKQTFRIYKKEKFDILHCHMNLNSFYHTFLGKCCHIKVRIAHSHLVEFPSGLISRLIFGIKKILNRLFATHYFACGTDAGTYLFGHKNMKKGNVFILKNAIDADKFLYNEATRLKLRTELNLENKFCIGHIGRFTEQKNHTFIINIFEEVHNQNKNAILLLFGTGERLNDIKKMVSKKKLSSYVKFMGIHTDIEQYYQIMDCFLFPSLYEGLGIVLVEAQAAGLSCVSSDVVPKEAKVSELVTFLSLDTPTSRWAQVILKQNHDRHTLNTKPFIEAAGYDIHPAAKLLEDWYCRHFCL